MKHYTHSKLILLLAFSIMIAACQKDKSPDNNDLPSLSESYQFVSDAENQFIEFGKQTGNNPYEAIILLEAWAKTREEVATAGLIDSTNLRVRLKSGLLTGIQFNIVDENGKSILRGGGSAGNLTAFRSQKACSKEIENKKVLIFSPMAYEFYDAEEEIKQVTDIFTESDGDYSVTVMKEPEATVENVRKFGEYGLVIINTHGQPDGFMLAPIPLILANDGMGMEKPVTEEVLKRWIVEFSSEEVLDMLYDGRLYHGGYINIKKGLLGDDWQWDVFLQKDYYYIFLSTKGILSMPQWDETVIFGNFCFSGWNLDFTTEPTLVNNPPIRKAILSRNPVTYYSYAFENGGSSRVSNEFAKLMEKHIARELVSNGDSTGVAHLDANGNENIDTYRHERVHLKQFASVNHCFVNCFGEGEMTDPRDGQVYRTICIDGKTWMAENLNYAVAGSGSWCYDDMNSNCNIYGRLYDWRTLMAGSQSSATNPSNVQGLCPPGWHIPSMAEYKEMMRAFITDTINPDPAPALKSRDLWNSPNIANNSSGFGVLPAGWYQPDEPPWNPEGTYGLGENALLWTTTEYRDIPDYPDDFAYYIPFGRTQNNFTYFGLVRNKSIGASCRCVKD
jgi:uncharacterized protein (TIGR02145 family)